MAVNSWCERLEEFVETQLDRESLSVGSANGPRLEVTRVLGVQDEAGCLH